MALVMNVSGKYLKPKVRMSNQYRAEDDTGPEGGSVKLDIHGDSIKVAIVPKAEVALSYDHYNDKWRVSAPWGWRLDVVGQTPDSITFRVRERTPIEIAAENALARKQHEAYLNAGGEG